MNYKTRPCRQFFLKGYCPYGYRCQYLHSETKLIEEFRSFLISAYKENGLKYQILENFESEMKKLQKFGIDSAGKKVEEILMSNKNNM